MRKVFFIVVVLSIFVLVGCGEQTRPKEVKPVKPPGSGNENVLKLDKTQFLAGEDIKVRFSASADFVDDAWVGIIPSDISHGSESVNDANDISYQYLKKRIKGTLNFKAPGKSGSYDFRMHDTDNNGKEVATVTFEVMGKVDKPSLKLSKTVFSRKEKIEVIFTAPSKYASNAWIGIIPSSISHGSEAKNDEHDIAYQYIKHRVAGTMIFTAPDEPGSYDFRMHDTDNKGKEVTHVSFAVK